MQQQRGAVEACWAHNSEVGGSKPFAANFFLIIIIIPLALRFSFDHQKKTDFSIVCQHMQLPKKQKG